jgi:hypothetical protein
LQGEARLILNDLPSAPGALSLCSGEDHHWTRTARHYGTVFIPPFKFNPASKKSYNGHEDVGDRGARYVLWAANHCRRE